MRLFLTGSVPLPFVLVLFAAAAAFTVAVYRRQRLARPWSIVLPGVRIAALAMLFLTLLQPVLSRVWNNTVKGHIAVVIDTSGSMSINDRYLPAEDVKAAWTLHLFPRKLRIVEFEGAKADARQVERNLMDFLGTAEQAIYELESAGVISPDNQRRLRQQNRQVQATRKTVTGIVDTLEGRIERSSYLTLSENVADIRGRVNCDYYDGIPGWEVQDLLDSPKYPDRPDSSRLLQALELPANRAEDYGARLRAIVYPPETGNYVFTIAADDQARLYLSDTATPDRKRRIATCPEWVQVEEFDRFDEQSSQPIPLAQGNAYYIEVVFKENKGDDHCTVGWIRPGGKVDVPIPSNYLGPYRVTPSLRLFAEEFQTFKARVQQTDQAMAALTETIDMLLGANGDEQRAQIAGRVRANTQQAAERAGPLASQLRRLQTLADETLAAVGDEEVQNGLAEFRTMTRLDIARTLLNGPVLDLRTLDRRGQLEVLTLADDDPVPTDRLEQLRPDLNSSRIASTIHDTANRYGKAPIAGILLLSDGNNNAGKTFGEVRQMLNERNIPVFSVGIGRSEPPDDIAIERVVAPDTSFKGDTVAVHAVLRRHGYEDKPIQVSVYSGETVLQTVTVDPGPEPIVTVMLSFQEEHEGLRHYTLEAEKMPGEAVEANNRKSFSISMLSDPIEALLVDQYPRWESRYANMMLERDTRIEVTTFFVASQTEGRLPGGEHGFPETKNELFAYDLLVLGDVDPNSFSAEQIDAIRDFVIERGGTLLAMAGPNHMPESFRNSAIRDILPFTVRPRPMTAHRSPRHADAVADAVSIPLQLTETGRFENPVQVGHTPEQSALLWSKLPGMNWVRQDVLPAEHASVLVTTAGDRNDPVVITAYVGLGKVIYLGSDSFWRWRYRTRWTYHHRFWGQILLWATLGRTAGSDPHVKLTTERPEYSPDETVTLKARVLDVDKTPLENGGVSARILDHAGNPVQNVRFNYLPQSGGEYRAVIRGLPKDRYTVRPSVNELQNVEIQADYTFEVRDLPTSEYIELALDEPSLRLISTDYKHITEADGLLDMIPEVREREQHRRDIELWDTLPFLALVAGMLGFEWQMRKRQKLV